MNITPTPFRRYVSLYTLHQVEGPGDLFVLRIRIETLRYSFAPLVRPALDAPHEVDWVYREDPRAGVELVQRAVLPRLQALLDARDPFEALGLSEGQDAAWQRYAAGRGLPAEPVRVPVIHAPVPARRLPARSKTSERLAQAHHALQLIQTAAETASTLAALWQNWQIRQGRRQLIDDQRALLHNTIQAQLAGQDQAFDHALNLDFVRGYLSAHGDDPGYEAVFEADEDA